MSVSSGSSLLRRVPPAGWVALGWLAGVLYAYLSRFQLPGEEGARLRAAQLLRWDGLLTMAIATGLAVYGCRLLERRPLGALGFLLAAAVVGTAPLAEGGIPFPQFIAVDGAVYLIAAHRSRRTGATALGLALATLAAYAAFRLGSGWNLGTAGQLAIGMTVVIAWLLGRSAHEARAHADLVVAQAAVQAVTAERLRIARETHDMVAHTIGIVALQAGAARRAFDTQPEQARQAIGEVENASRETLSGLRRMLGALRQAEGDGGSPVQPPGLADLPRLAATTTAAGITVDVTEQGEGGPLPHEVDLAAFRIVQEAVTNVVKHSGARSCRVALDHREKDLMIEISDAGRGAPPVTGAGFGLTGMRERVALLGGDFAAGSQPGGGFRVTARLPLPAEAVR